MAFLDVYKSKRNFSRTSEPSGKSNRSLGKTFVVQKHSSRHLHYDFRLSFAGVLKSWAVPKGLPGKKEKKLAVQTEDHPIEYSSFEGLIPKGEYGAGRVEIWDKGFYEPESGLRSGLKKGHIKFKLIGRKAKGFFSLIRLKNSDKNWLMIRHDNQA